jgi:hypothetical protein
MSLDAFAISRNKTTGLDVKLEWQQTGNKEWTKE